MDDATPDPLDLSVVSQEVDPAVASPKERAQEPADERDNDRPENRPPEAMNLEARDDFADQLQHQRVNDQNEKPEGEQDKRDAEKKKNRADECVDDAQEKRRPKQTTDSGVAESDDICGHKDGERSDKPPKDKVPHGLHYELLAEFYTNKR